MSPTKRRKSDATPIDEGAPPRVRLPGFLIEEDIGLGDAIQRATAYVGLTPCAGCDRRATVLNHWLTFTARQRR